MSRKTLTLVELLYSLLYIFVCLLSLVMKYVHEGSGVSMRFLNRFAASLVEEEEIQEETEEGQNREVDPVQTSPAVRATPLQTPADLSELLPHESRRDGMAEHTGRTFSSLYEEMQAEIHHAESSRAQFDGRNVQS
ncbi:unnamed protein product [Calypogeia fissa]